MRKKLFWLLVVGAIGFLARAGIQFLEPAYWRPVSFVDYTAVILTTVNAFIFALVLLIMLRMRPARKGVIERVWRVAIIVAAIGSTLSGLGNLLEDAFRLSRVGGGMYTVGGIGAAFALLTAFLAALGLPDIRFRWSWFYALPLVGAILLIDFDGFITGAGMLLAATQIRFTDDA